MNVFLSMISGILLALAFPKLSLYGLAWIALVPFFIALLRAKNLGSSLLCGFLFGIVFFGIHFLWIFSLFRFSGGWVALGWAALVLFQTMFILLYVLLLYAFRRLSFFPLAAALLWVFVEWLRTLGPLGVPHGGIYFSQVKLLPLIQIVSYTSVYGISFLVVLVNATVACIFGKPAPINRGGFLILPLLLVVAAYSYGLFELRGNREVYSQVSEPKIKISLIQPNIDQADKMDPAKVRPVFDLHEKLTLQAAEQRPDIIIWPETAIFSYVLRDQALLSRIQNLAKDTRAWLVFGTPHYAEKHAYNSIVSMSPQGQVVSRYDKQKLVPFGEYLPFRIVLYPLLKGVGYYDQEYSSNPKPELLLAANLKISAAICFESTFPGLIRKNARDADFILTVTNDAWFGDSSVPYFHLDAGVFRAIENRKYFVQVGNTGISAVIDPRGRVLKKTNLNQQAILHFAF